MLIAPTHVHAQTSETQTPVEPQSTATPTPNIEAADWVKIARDGAKQPPMLLPWPAGEKWIMSGGPHAFSDPEVTVRAALDFAPSNYVTCSNNAPVGFSGTYHKVLAVAPGLVITSGNGEVSVDMDGDGDPNSGWVVVYYHIENTPARAEVGKYVQPSDVIGNPGCTFGTTTLEHVHILRKFNGEHIAVDDRETPFNLSGWTFQSGQHDYEGSGYHPVQGRIERNGDPITSDNSSSAYMLRSKLDLGNIKFSGQTIRFRIPGSWFKPGLQVRNPKQLGAYVDGRLKAVDKNWLLPVASQTLSSAEEDHTAPGRGSVNAWDLSVKEGAAVYPISPGVVTYAGCNNAGNYGCWVKIKHDDGFQSLYAHLIDERDPSFKIPKGSGGDPQGHVLVKTGQKVGQWDPVGRVGWTGLTSFGPHTHFELFTSDGARTRIDTYFDKGKMQVCKLCSAKEWVYDTPFVGRNRLPVDAEVEIPVEVVLLALLYVAMLSFWLLLRSDKEVQKRPVIRTIANSFGWKHLVRLMVVFTVFVVLVSGVGIGTTLYVNAQPVPDIFSEMLENIETKEDLEGVVKSLKEEFPNLDVTKFIRLPLEQRRAAWTTYLSTNSEIKIPWMPIEVMRWEKEIVTASKRHGIDPEFLAIICWVESKGDPKAGSGAGAQGLVQVMPGTAAGIARERGITNYDIWDPQTNLDFGAYYLAQQLKSFGRVNDPDNQQSVELAAIAYNGGPGRAQDYIAGRSIPSETQRYLKLVGGMWRERHQLTSPTFLGR